MDHIGVGVANGTCFFGACTYFVQCFSHWPHQLAPRLVRLRLHAFLQAEHVAGKVERAADEDALRPRLVLIGALQGALDAVGPLGLEPDAARGLRQHLRRMRCLVRARDRQRRRRGAQARGTPTGSPPIPSSPSCRR